MLLEKAEAESGDVTLRSLERKIALEREKRAKSDERLREVENLLADSLKREQLWNAIQESRRAPKDCTPKPGKRDKASVVLLCSDWHIGQRVERTRVNGLNEFNPDIAAKRVEKMTANFLKLVANYQTLAKTDSCVVWLGGDLITGYIHEELEESNYLAPWEEARLAKELVADMLSSLLKSKIFRDFHIVCNRGNHGRTTKKKRVSTSFENSYETMLYFTLKDEIERYWKESKRIRWTIAEGEQAIVNISGWNHRFQHGDFIRFGGGIGGLEIPVKKALARKTTTIPIHFDYLAHFHQFTPNKRFLVNNCLIGYDEYATANMFEFSKPSQSMVVVHPTHGVVDWKEVFVD